MIFKFDNVILKGFLCVPSKALKRVFPAPRVGGGTYVWHPLAPW